MKLWLNFLKESFVVLSIISISMVWGSAYATPISDALSSFYEIDSEQGEITIMWLGNHQKGQLEGHASAGFIIKTLENVLVIDPSNLLSDDLDSLEKVDFILITHDHADHFDPDSTIALQKKTDAFVIANSAAFEDLNEKISNERLVSILPNNFVTINGIKVTAFLGEHPSEMPLLYMIEVDGFRLFDGSDSAYVDALKYIESEVHVAFVPTGSPSPTASPSDAFEMTKATKPYVVIPMHGTPEQMQKFAKLVEESELETRVIIPEPLQLIIPAEVIPEFSASALIMLVSIASIILVVVVLKKTQKSITVFLNN